ncbi:hypothetical protein BCV72DRAFT_214998, partial [Rhizopus microsporus var. microsporus]
TLSRRKEEADKANVEFWRMNASDLKITTDRIKLFIESKCVLDHLVVEKTANAGDIAIPALQLIGNKSRLYSLRLVASVLYISVKKASAYIPSRASSIKVFRDVIELLFTFKVRIRKKLR